MPYRFCTPVLVICCHGIASCSDHYCNLIPQILTAAVFFCYIIRLSGQHIAGYGGQKCEALGDFDIFSAILNPHDYFCALKRSPLTYNYFFMLINKIKFKKKGKKKHKLLQSCDTAEPIYHEKAYL